MESYPTIGHRVIQLPSVDSTNNYAATGIARQELRHGTAIMAFEQTAGKGQRGREWSTSAGLDLAASLVLIPEDFPAVEQFNLAKAAALAVHDVVADAMDKAGRNPIAVRIKWPNDVLIDRNKVAGILIVNELHGHRLASAIVGVGINVNSTGLARELIATSLIQETRVPHDLRQLLDLLCARMEHWWTLLVNEPDVVSERYAERLWARNRFSDFTLDGAEFNARPLGVDEAGRLIVEDETGQVAAYGLERLRFQR
ncbi:MAG: biotin--[acetyl-CoA-carboxylase] ligase [Flavobacteriales bacterium]|nr:biotin--[acetyl-CoA-carboxylase] ligase [Flavobacteriales bacterium]